MTSKNRIAIFCAALLAFASLAPLAAAQEEKRNIPKYAQDIAVTIRAESTNQWSNGSEGSGAFKVTKDGQVWVWTCGHVIEGLRYTITTPNGKKKIRFRDAKVVIIHTERGRRVGEANFDAEVIRYSDDENQDLALLRIRSKKFRPDASVDFYLGDKIPHIGTELYHCGSLLGQVGSNSLTSGIVSQIGRVFLQRGVVFDQVTCTSFPGSSGGLVIRKSDGKYIGMVVRGAGETFTLTVPVRRMYDWAKKVGVAFAMDDSVQVPSDEELFKHPIDDSVSRKGARAEAHADAMEEQGFRKRIHYLPRLVPATSEKLRNRIEAPVLLPSRN